MAETHSEDQYSVRPSRTTREQWRVARAISNNVGIQKAGQAAREFQYVRVLTTQSLPSTPMACVHKEALLLKVHHSQEIVDLLVLHATNRTLVAALITSFRVCIPYLAAVV